MKNRVKIGNFRDLSAKKDAKQNVFFGSIFTNERKRGKAERDL
jgi:hypothetical protein